MTTLVVEHIGNWMRVIGSAGVGAIVAAIRWWWRQPDHFDWLVAYLRVRRMSTMTRAVVIAVTTCLGIVPFATLIGSPPPIRTTLGVLAGVGAFAGAALWFYRFPTRNQSIAFSIGASIGTAFAVLAQSDPMTAMLGCTTFAAISGYIALFHTAALMVTNLIIILAVSAVPATALVVTHGVVRAASAYAVMLVVNIAVPYGVQIIVHTLGVDLLKADRDPLTGLYNRRAFYRRTAGLVTASGGAGTLLVAMIDLDEFKRLNDTHGHTEGDLALAAVGRALRDHAPRGSVIGRAGGEEFLIAVGVGDSVTGLDDSPTDVVSGPTAFARRVCAAIEALPFPITASVGTACAPFGEVLASASHYDQITELIAAADAAMYEAKRNGGNRTRHHRPPSNSSGRGTCSHTSQRWEVPPPGQRTEAPLPSPENDPRRLLGRDWSASW